MTWLFRLTGWKIFRPARAPWGEATDLWTEGDWRWFRRYQAPVGYLKTGIDPIDHQ